MSISDKQYADSRIPRLSPEEAEHRHYLSLDLLNLMHLAPVGEPAACAVGGDGETIYYFDPNRVVEADPELWYRSVNEQRETTTLESGVVVEKMGTKRAAAMGYYTAERLNQMNYDVVMEPVAYTVRNDGSKIFFYDKRTAIRRPLLCTVCGKGVRYKRKMCRDCFERDLAVRRAEGDAYRARAHHMDRTRVLFFDLELTGVYDHDEIISVSIMNAMGEVLMDTLVKPLHKKKWNRTEKIHGITPAMVQDAPTLDELIPSIKEMFARADNLIAYGVSTDYSHIKYIYETEEEQEALRRKTRCAAIEFVRYQNEHYPDNTHASLVDAMATMGITWEGIPHSSIADTIGCMKVWEALFPNYYSTPAPEAVSCGMTGIPYELEGKNKLERAAHMAAKVVAAEAAAAEAEADDGTEDDADGETAFTVAEAAVNDIVNDVVNDGVNDVVKDGDERVPAPEEVAYV